MVEKCHLYTGLLIPCLRKWGWEEHVHLTSSDTDLEGKAEEAGPAITIVSASVIPIFCGLGLSLIILGTKDTSFYCIF